MENKLKIEYINILGLFGKRDIKLDLKNLVHIYVGINGCGKTTVLKILKNIFLGNLKGLIQFNFKEIQIKFKDENAVNIKYEDIFGWNNNISNFIKLIEKYKTKEKVIFLSSFRQLEKNFPVDNLENLNNNIENYIKTCEKFLYNKKIKVNFSEFKNKIDIELYDKENLSDKINISNGELQILSIFFKLYFKNKEDIILLIDEPEISLSINWQEELIPEMVNTEKCSLIIAMTHSPFIFKNEYFDKCTKEL